MTNLALIGAGSFGAKYIATLESLPDISLKYICTSSDEKKKLYAKHYIVINNYKELSKMDDIDGVIICTPASTHYTIGKYFLEKKFNVLFEKPLTTSYFDAKKLLTLWKRTKTVILVGHTYLYSPAFLTVCRYLAHIGEIRSLDFTGANWGPVRADVSVLWDWSAHDIAMCLAILPYRPRKVEAFGETILEKSKGGDFDSVSIRLFFSKNIVVTIRNSRISLDKVRRAVVIGTKGGILFDDLAKKKVSYYPTKGTQHIFSRDDQPIFPTISRTTPLASEILEFVRCIKTKKNPHSDLVFGAKVVEIIQSTEKSIKEKRSIIF